MGKIILLVLVVFGAWWILKRYRNTINRDASPPPAARGSGEDMVQCAKCGVHLPRSESVGTDNRFYCSTDHQRLHRPPG